MDIKRIIVAFHFQYRYNENIDQEVKTTALEMFSSGYPRIVGMKYFPNVTTLILIGQSNQKISALEYCLLFKELWIAEHSLVKIDGLQKCVHLQKLYLYFSDISRIESQEALKKLNVLWLNNNLIKNVEAFQHLQCYIRLKLYCLKHSESLHTLQNLQEVNLSGNLIEKIGSLSGNGKLYTTYKMPVFALIILQNNQQVSRTLNVLQVIHFQFQLCQVHNYLNLVSQALEEIKKSFNLVAQFLLMELETVGNIHFEKVLPMIPVWDFRAYSIMGMKINSIFRVHSQNLRLKFKEKFQISLFSIRKDGISLLSMWPSLEQSNCDCSHWHCKWFVFDLELVLPEYITEFKYITLLKGQCLFSMCNIIVEEGKRSTERFILSHYLQSDDEVLNMEPTVKVRPQIAGLNKKKPHQYFQWLRPMFSQVLNLSGSSLSMLQDISRLKNLQKLIISFNEFFDVGHNHVITFEGVRGLSKLQFFNLSWNHLKKSREDKNMLHKHTLNILLDMKHNPWHKPASFHLSVIGLEALTNLDGVLISNEEVAEALQYIAGSKMSQIPVSNLDEQLFKICNLEKLEHLRWASFSNNNLTETEGIDLNLEELTLDENYISTLDGISKLSKITRHSVNNHNLISLERHVSENLPYLHYVSIENDRITSLVGLKKTYSLIKIYISNNFVYTNEIQLKGLANLIILDMSRNIVWNQDHYQLIVLFHLPSLKALDDITVEPREGESAKDLFGGKLTSDMTAGRLGHLDLMEMQELNWTTSSIRAVELVLSDQFRNVCGVNLQNNNLMSFSGLILLPNAKVSCLNCNHIESILPEEKLPNQVTNRQQLYKMASHGYGQEGLDKESKDTEFGENLQSLEDFPLGYNGIAYMAQLQLSRLKNLEILVLQSSQIEGLEGLQFLQELVLDCNSIKEISQGFLASQNSLLTLHLENQIRKLIHLQPLVKLQRLFLDSNRIQESSELKLQVIPSLKVLSKHRNPTPDLRFSSCKLSKDSGFPALPANFARHNPLRITNGNLNENINHLFGSDLIFGHELEAPLLKKPNDSKQRISDLKKVVADSNPDSPLCDTTASELGSRFLTASRAQDDDVVLKRTGALAMGYMPDFQMSLKNTDIVSHSISTLVRAAT
ncbi:LOW QUALITY PROTEIN: leucine-rich repeat-containing protein 9 [Leptosomus discolor]